MMMTPPTTTTTTTTTTVSLIFLILTLSNIIPLCSARKAIGGSGGLLSGSSGGRQPNIGGGDSPASDPLKLVDISDNNQLSNWMIPPLNSEQVIEKLGKEYRDVAYYINNELSKAPLSIQLLKKRVGVKQPQDSGNFVSATKGVTSPMMNTFSNQEKYRAVVKSTSTIKGMNKNPFKKSKMKSVWYISSDRAASQASMARQQNEELLTKSYDENISHFHPAHFVLEVFLPKTKACVGGGNPLIRYCIPMGAGTTSPKSRVSQSNGVVTIYPNGRKRKDGSGESKNGEESENMVVGSTSLHLNVGTSLVDPTWARGRKYFWKGRSVGQI